jgi:hypothetical protein
VELLWGVEGHGDAAYAEERRRQFRQQLVLVSPLYNALYNFGTKKVRVDPEHPDRLQLGYCDEGVMPRSCRFAVLGFWNELGLRWSTTCRPDFLRLEHFSDHYILRMTRNLWDASVRRRMVAASRGKS